MRKRYALAFFLGYMACNAVANAVISRQDAKFNHLLGKAQLYQKVLEKFVEYSPPELTAQINKELAFDFIVADLSDLDSKG